jgi:hypothetical protein
LEFTPVLGLKPGQMYELTTFLSGVHFSYQRYHYYVATLKVKQLNDACPCGHDDEGNLAWEIGVSKTIKPHQCHLKDDKDYPYLCYLANGTNSYANYKYADFVKDAPKTYISSAVRFDQIDGWTGVPSSVPRYVGAILTLTLTLTLRAVLMIPGKMPLTNTGTAAPDSTPTLNSRTLTT